MTQQELQNLIKSASDKMRADDNTKSANKYLEHFSWLLFLKVFEAVEDDRAVVAEINQESFERVIEGQYQWSAWTKSGMTGPALIAFINDELLPYLRSRSGSPRANKVAAIFQGVTTVMKSGYVLAEVVEIVDKVDFHAADDYHTMTVLYETLLGQTSDAGWSGEFYTPRPIVDFMVQVVNPELGVDVYDPCAGSCGFLASVADHLVPQATTTEDQERLQSHTFYGQEAGELPYLIGTMHMMLHGIMDPQIVRRNTLEQDVRNIGPSEQHSLILTNPPYGGTENPQVQQNFPARSSATELLFLQHVMAKLKQGGDCGIVLPDGILFRTEAAFSAVRRRLVNEYNVTAIVRLPSGVFSNAPGARTNLIFFDRRAARSQTIRYYQVLPPPGKPAFSKTEPLTAEHLDGALAWIRDGESDGRGWEVDISEVIAGGYDLNATPRLPRNGASADATQHLQYLIGQSAAIAEAAERLEVAAAGVTDYSVVDRIPLAGLIEERGERAGAEELTKLLGVSNTGGLAPFKGKAGSNTSRYRRVEVGDFVYNPMRINVGSLALCRHPSEEGWASPDYVVFRLKEDAAPFSSEYLLRYLKSPVGREEINRHVQGSVRARLYFENMERVEVPVPATPEPWHDLLVAIESVRRSLLVGVGDEAIGELEQVIFGQDPAAQG